MHCGEGGDGVGCRIDPFGRFSPPSRDYPWRVVWGEGKQLTKLNNASDNRPPVSFRRGTPLRFACLRLHETIAHAKAVAGRAATILSRAKLDIAGQVAKVDPEGCVACATCVKVCPYGAPMINDLKKAEIQGATCMGCGSCAAECPAHTITLQHQEDGQMTAMLDELLSVGGGAT